MEYLEGLFRTLPRAHSSWEIVDFWREETLRLVVIRALVRLNVTEAIWQISGWLTVFDRGRQSIGWCLSIKLLLCNNFFFVIFESVVVSLQERLVILRIWIVIHLILQHLPTICTHKLLVTLLTNLLHHLTLTFFKLTFFTPVESLFLFLERLNRSISLTLCIDVVGFSADAWFESALFLLLLFISFLLLLLQSHYFLLMFFLISLHSLVHIIVNLLSVHMCHRRYRDTGTPWTKSRPQLQMFKITTRLLIVFSLKYIHIFACYGFITFFAMTIDVQRRGDSCWTDWLWWNQQWRIKMSVSVLWNVGTASSMVYIDMMVSRRYERLLLMRGKLRSEPLILLLLVRRDVLVVFHFHFILNMITRSRFFGFRRVQHRRRLVISN